MSSLTPAQRRVLEAAQRGELICHLHVGHDLYSVSIESPNGGVAEDCTATVEALFSAGLVEPGVEAGVCRVMDLTAVGRAELGITETEED